MNLNKNESQRKHYKNENVLSLKGSNLVYKLKFEEKIRN